jgi:Domain of unknown function (DUF4105)
MASTDSRQSRKLPVWISKPIRWLLRGISFIFGILLVTWATLALYYSNLPWAWLRLLLALIFLAFSIWALWFSRKPRMLLLFTALFLAVLSWYIYIPPRHNRQWQPQVALMPRAYINGDKVLIIGVRDFDYRTKDDFTAHYQEREVSLSHLTSVDFFLSYWTVGPVGHTFLSFNFDNAPPICISIETRPKLGQGYSPIASLFKQYELIYVVGDERDIVRLRTHFRDEDVYLYHIRIPPEKARALFLVYLDRINQLADHPEFYHLLSNSCTINIVRYANAIGRKGRLDIRQVLNGWVDRYLYRTGRVDTSMPFDELRKRSHINEVAEAADNSPDFSQRIRAPLPPAQP